jgi:hypothetical protein
MDETQTKCFEREINARLVNNLNRRKEEDHIWSNLVFENIYGRKIVPKFPRIVNSNFIRPNESLPTYPPKNILPTIDTTIVKKLKMQSNSRQTLPSPIINSRGVTLFVPKSEKVRSILETHQKTTNNKPPSILTGLPVIPMNELYTNNQNQLKVSVAESPTISESAAKVVINSPEHPTSISPSKSFLIEPFLDVFIAHNKSKGTRKSLRATTPTQFKGTLEKVQYYETLDQVIGVTPRMSVFNEPSAKSENKETRMGKKVLIFGRHTTIYPKIVMKLKKKKKRSVVKVEVKEKLGKHSTTYELKQQEASIDINRAHQSEKLFFNHCVAKFNAMNIDYDRARLHSAIVGVEDLQKKDTEEEQQMRRIALKRGTAKIFIRNSDVR